jgi:hypothetical protein
MALSGDADCVRVSSVLFVRCAFKVLDGPIAACRVLARGNPLEVPRYEVEESISKAASASLLSLGVMVVCAADTVAVAGGLSMAGDVFR